MFTVLMTLGKMDTLNLLKIKISWSNVYDVIISVYDAISKILSRDWNFIVVVASGQSLVTLAFLWEKLL